MINDLKIKLENYSFKINNGKVKLLKDFYFFLKEINEQINLISRKNFDKTFSSLVFQSIWIANKIIPFNSLIDVGSGAGFPGIPIKIYCPFIKIYLVEPKRKKVNFLVDLGKKLGLNNMEVMRCDFSQAIELLGKKEEKLDYLISQGIRKKEKLVTEKYNIIQKGYIFLTGSKEINRLRKLKKLNKYQWFIHKLPEKENFFMIMLKK